MFQNVDGDKEIVLENRQLLGIFFLFAVLLGVTFVAGFMVGHGSFDFAKKTPAATASGENTGAQTRTVEPASSPSGGSSGSAVSGSSADDSAAGTAGEKPLPDAEPPVEKQAPSGKRAPAKAEEEKPKSRIADEGAGAGAAGLYEPQAGQRFWQVTAQSREKAETVARDLIHSGFSAHVAVSPDPRLFRVLVGPLKNQSEAASTRVGLRDKGFNSVMARNY